MTTVSQLIAQVRSLTYEEMSTLNRVLVAQMKTQSKLKQIAAASAFSVGDSVKFDAKTRGIRIIKIESFSRDGSKIKGVEASGVRWTVAASLCKKSV